jgi:hypothetical protein
MESLLIFIGFVFVSAFSWLLYCNDKTCSQRLKLIRVAFHDPSGEWNKDSTRYVYMLDKVSYGEHNRALLLFRSPFDLYDQRLIERLRNDP